MPKSFGVKHKNLAHCKACPLKGRPIVPGYGKLNKPEIAFVAEAPGETEAQEGIPLIGKSGAFLRRVMDDVGIDEDQCYFTNMNMCAPTKDDKKDKGKPSADMVRACLGRVTAELVDVQPKLVVALGNTSATFLAGHKHAIGKCHGIYREVEFRPKTGRTHSVGIVPTYHPAGVLRGPERFRDFVEELEYVRSIMLGAPPVIEPPYENYRHLTTQEDLNWLCGELPKHPLVACDVEANGTLWNESRLLCIGFSWKKEYAWVLDWKLLEHDLANVQKLNAALEGVNLVFHNGVFDAPFMHFNGLPNSYFYLDTLQVHYLLDERQLTHGLERLAIKYYRAPDYKEQFRSDIGLKSWVGEDEFASKFADAPQEDLFDYNGADTDYTFRLAVDLTKEVIDEGQTVVLRDIEMPAARAFMEFYTNGLLIDRDYLIKTGEKWVAEKERLTQEMRDSSGLPEMNPNSTKQMAEYMFDELKLAPFGGREWMDKPKIDEGVISKAIQSVDDPEAREYWTSKRTTMSSGMKGFGGSAKGITPRSTSAYCLYFLRQQHDFPNLLLQYRHVQKRQSLYFKGFSKFMDSAGRIHPRYNMAATRTGRKQTKNPAIHNFPRGDEIYNLIIADPGWCLIHADYSQAEMRIVAHLCLDKNLIHVLQTSDPHTSTAIMMFELSDEEVAQMSKHEMSDKRIAAKMITYGLPYGRSPAGLAPQLGVSKKEAVEFSKSYFNQYPVLKQWLDDQKKFGVEEQMVTNIFGRRRRFPLITSRYHTREVMRQAVNAPIQSASNDLTLLAYTRSIDRLRENGIPVKPGAHIHDSLNVSVPMSLWRPSVEIIVATMVDIPFKSKIDFPAEAEIGVRWGDMFTVHKNNEWVLPEPGDNSPEWLYAGLSDLILQETTLNNSRAAAEMAKIDG